MGRLRAALAATLIGFSSALPASDDLTVGRSIYEAGRGGEGLSATLGDPPVTIGPAARACALCHGSTGTGGSEGGIVAPSLVPGTRSEAQLTQWLAGAVRRGRGASDRKLLTAMPRYSLTDAELAALASYVRTFPYPPQVGLDGEQVRITLDLEGSRFTADERDVLQDWVGRQLDRVNAEGGLFGRRLLAASESSDSFFTISWVAPSARAHLAIIAPSLDTPPCASCCASLHASVREQVDWLQQWLDARKVAAQVRGPLADALPTGAAVGIAAAIVHLGRPETVTVDATQALYLFADLGTPSADLAARPQTYLVTAIDLAQRLAQVSALQREYPVFASSPRLAAAAIELQQAVSLVIDALTTAGRRVTTRAVCEAVRDATRSDRRYSMLDLSTGVVVEDADPR